MQPRDQPTAHSASPNKALSVIDAFAKRNPENAAAQGALGLALVSVDRLDDASRVSMSRARLLDPINPNVANADDAIAQVLREDWSAATDRRRRAGTA